MPEARSSNVFPLPTFARGKSIFVLSLFKILDSASVIIFFYSCEPVLAGVSVILTLVLLKSTILHPDKRVETKIAWAAIDHSFWSEIFNIFMNK